MCVVLIFAVRFCTNFFWFIVSKVIFVLFSLLELYAVHERVVFTSEYKWSIASYNWWCEVPMVNTTITWGSSSTISFNKFMSIPLFFCEATRNSGRFNSLHISVVGRSALHSMRTRQVEGCCVLCKIVVLLWREKYIKSPKNWMRWYHEGSLLDNSRLSLRTNLWFLGMDWVH